MKGIIWNIVNVRGGGDPASFVISDYSPNPTLNGKNLMSPGFILFVK